MYQQPADIIQERRRRLLYLVFSLGMGAALVICAVLGYLVMAPDTPVVRLGSEGKFTGAAEAPVHVPVKRLGISRLIPNRPSLSEDVIFVVRDRDRFRAFLGTSPSSGCFLTWRTAEEVFADTCGSDTYGFTGRNTNQLAVGANQVVNMVELPVQLRDGTLFVEDRILRRDIR